MKAHINTVNVGEGGADMGNVWGGRMSDVEGVREEQMFYNFEISNRRRFLVCPL